MQQRRPRVWGASGATNHSGIRLLLQTRRTPSLQPSRALECSLRSDGHFLRARRVAPLQRRIQGRRGPSAPLSAQGAERIKNKTHHSISCPCLLLLGQRLVAESPTVTSSPARVTSGRRLPEPGSDSSRERRCSTDAHARARECCPARRV